MQKKITSIVFILLAITSSLLAQNKHSYSTWNNGRKTATTSSAITTPPNFPVRAAAEWEEVQALFITWTSFPAIQKEIVRYAQQECKVVIVCTDSNTVKNYLTTNNVPITNVGFLKRPYNTIWMRDYGGNTVYKNEVEDLLMVDWIYNRPRPKDDTIPAAHANYFGIPEYSTTALPYDLVHTGGNYMSDGLGTAFSSNLVLDENDGQGYSLAPKTSAQIDTIMKKFMGINRYIKMATLPYDGIHHIDMHMKLLDEQTILMGLYPQGVADGPQIEANLQYVLANYNSSFGTPYKVVRVTMPSDGGLYPNSTGDYLTYTNSVFINKTILLPIYNLSSDTTAIRIYKESLPGYKVIGIPCTDIIQQSGAIHCITHSLGVQNPLWIVHQPLEDAYQLTTPFTVNANIKHGSGIATANVYYRVQPDTIFTAVPMTLTNATQNTWSANIPNPGQAATIEYYVEGNANSGKKQYRPMPAPEGFYTFHVLSASAISAQTAMNEKMMQSIFPNPASAITCIPINANKSQKGNIEIWDIMGRKLQTIFEGNIPQGESKYFIDAQRFVSGTYLIVLQTEQGKEVQKLMVK